MKQCATDVKTGLPVPDYDYNACPQQFRHLQDADPTDHTGGVYFLQGAYGGPIKIGWTSQHPAQRAQQCQTGNPHRLIVRRFVHDPMGFADSDDPGSCKLERQLHGFFSGDRMVGEWFAATDDLAAVARAIPDSQIGDSEAHIRAEVARRFDSSVAFERDDAWWRGYHQASLDLALRHFSMLNSISLVPDDVVRELRRIRAVESGRLSDRMHRPKKKRISPGNGRGDWFDNETLKDWE